MASPTPKKPILSTLGQLKTWTTVVADTGDFEGNLKFLTLSCKVPTSYDFLDFRYLGL